MGTVEQLALWASVLSGTVTVGAALAALVAVASRRVRGWLLDQLGVRELQSRVGALAERYEELFRRLDRELAAASEERRTNATQLLALAYVMENPDADLDVAAFAREHVTEEETRAADFIEGEDLLRGGSE